MQGRLTTQCCNLPCFFVKHNQFAQIDLLANRFYFDGQYFDDDPHAHIVRIADKKGWYIIYTWGL